MADLCKEKWDEVVTLNESFGGGDEVEEVDDISVEYFTVEEFETGETTVNHLITAHEAAAK